MGTVSRLKAAMEDWPEERQLEVRLKQGIPVMGVEVRDPRRPRAKTCPGTASTSASWSCAVPGSPGATTRIPAPSGVFHRRRLVPHRRHGDDRPARLRADHRPQERPDQAQGRVDLERRHGKPGAGASRACSRRPWSGASDEVCDEVPVVFVVQARSCRAAGRGAGDHRLARAPSSGSGSCPAPKTSASSSRCPRPASASWTRR